MSNATLLLGSNLGDSAAYMTKAYAALELKAGAIVGHTSVHRTAPWGYESQNDYLNQIVVIETALAPLQLLDIVLDIETSLGRTRSTTERYADRTIDIDILYYDNITLTHPRLTIPHPRIEERQFVLALLAEL